MDKIPKWTYVKCGRCGTKVHTAAEFCALCAKPEELFTCSVCPELREEIKKLREALLPFAEQAKHMGEFYATEKWMAKKEDYVNAYNLLEDKEGG